jgi:RimJ/RimL family protein N-acetyltransferase
MTLELIRWQDLSAAEQAAVRALNIPRQQLEFAGRTENALASVEATDNAYAHQSPHNLVGLAIRSNEGIVGFLALKRGDQAPSWANAQAAVVSGMRIDQSQQGKGMGTAALKMLAAWMAAHWPESSCVSLEVDEENTGAICAYKKAGFADDGVRKLGRIGWVWTLTMQVTAGRDS